LSLLYSCLIEDFCFMKIYLFDQAES